MPRIRMRAPDPNGPAFASYSDELDQWADQMVTWNDTVILGPNDIYNPYCTLISKISEQSERFRLRSWSAPTARH